MRFVGLDQALRHSGAAVLDGDRFVLAEAFHAKSPGQGGAFHEFRNWWEGFLERHKPDHVAIEEPLRSDMMRTKVTFRPNDAFGQSTIKTKEPLTNMQTLLGLYGVRAHAIEVCEMLGIEYVEVNNQEWRGVIHGQRHAPKRKQLSKTEYQAGVRIQEAFDTLTAGPGGVMDFDRVRGGSSPGSPPSPPQIDASNLLNLVQSVLYNQDWAVVLRVCGQGMSIEETTENLYGKPTSRAQRDDCGRRLKEGLRQMADRWFPRERSEQGGRMRFSRSERPTVTDSPTAAPGSVAHATTDRVYRS